jgi:hypothetical protein
MSCAYLHVLRAHEVVLRKTTFYVAYVKLQNLVLK